MKIKYLNNIKNFLKNILVVENILRTLIAYNFSEKYGNDNYLKLDNFETLKNSGCNKKKYCLCKQFRNIIY